ncbi:MAG: hypothetical protein HQK49_13120 [Oligoflexia bacterium]|nr:hypothetical protein [Oligoflexia bacterium]
MRYSYICFFIMTVLSLYGCSSVVEVKEGKSIKFNSNETITVICRGKDELGLSGELEHILISQGFDVVSEEVAKNKAKTVIDVNLNNKKIEGTVEDYNVKELQSVYALSFSYTTAYDGLFSERKINKLHGSVIDLHTGKIIKSLKIERNSMSLKSNVEILEELVTQMKGS